MKNHYISQFVIGRFSDAINIFDIHSGKIDENKRPHKVFFHEDIFDEETEKLFNFIESRVANIISQKILAKGKVVLTRKELVLLKRYMLISSVRTQSPDFFCKILRGFEKNADHYISIRKCYCDDCGVLPSANSLQLSDKELFQRALKVFSTTETFRDISEHPLATKEMLAWAIPFLESYLAFWDAPENKEFVLTDCGMSTEYEGFHLITGGVDISKVSYLQAQSKAHSAEYGMLMATNCVMYENYNLFVISSSRCMVCINPFFRLYHGFQTACVDERGVMSNKSTLKKPDIWPAIIQHQELFDTPENEYKFGIPHYTEDDKFIYQAKVLTEKDMIYINTLLLSQANEIIGFNDARKIIDSIYYFVWHQGNFNSVKSLSDTENEIVDRLIDGVLHSPYHSLCSYCDSKGGVNKTEFIFLFEELTNYIYKDFNSNPYICKYYLSMPEETIHFHALDFLGEGEKRLDVFRGILERIQKEKEQYV